MSSRVILDSLAAQVRAGKLGNKAASLQRPTWGP
jgi:agmatinase